MTTTVQFFLSLVIVIASAFSMFLSNSCRAASATASAFIQGTLTGGTAPVTVKVNAVNLISSTAQLFYTINSGPFQQLSNSNTPASFTVNQGDMFAVVAGRLHRVPDLFIRWLRRSAV